MSYDFLDKKADQESLRYFKQIKTNLSEDFKPHQSVSEVCAFLDKVIKNVEARIEEKSFEPYSI